MATRKFITKTWTSSDDNFASYAVIELGEEGIKKILNNREIFRMAEAKTKSLYCMSFWTDAVTFFSWFDVEETLGEEKYNELEDDRWIEIDSDCNPFESQEPDRTCCAKLVITSDGFYFEAVAKYCNTQCESEKIPYEVLLGD